MKFSQNLIYQQLARKKNFKLIKPQYKSEIKKTYPGMSFLKLPIKYRWSKHFILKKENSAACIYVSDDLWNSPHIEAWKIKWEFFETCPALDAHRF